jgi:hypothetical protein
MLTKTWVLSTSKGPSKDRGGGVIVAVVVLVEDRDDVIEFGPAVSVGEGATMQTELVR